MITTNTPAFDCPLCRSDQTTLQDRDRHRHYYRCHSCQLIFVPAVFHLGANEEKAIYDLHENNSEDLGYRGFLSRLVQPLLKVLPIKAEGLDFGCGPGPTLHLMLEEQGFKMNIFDPVYHNKPEVLTCKYDFVTATEVVEHFSNPAAMFAQLFDLLRPGGALGLMTKLVPDNLRISSWHYARDLTHISFYSQKSFEYLADQYQCQLKFVGSDVIIMRLDSGQVLKV